MTTTDTRATTQRRTALRTALAPGGVLDALRPAGSAPTFAVYLDGADIQWPYAHEACFHEVVDAMPLDQDRTGFVLVDGAKGMRTEDGRRGLSLVLHADPAVTADVMTRLAADPGWARHLAPVRVSHTAAGVTVTPWTLSPAAAERARLAALLPPDWTVHQQAETVNVRNADGQYQDAPDGTPAVQRVDTATGTRTYAARYEAGRYQDARDGSPAVQQWDEATGTRIYAAQYEAGRLADARDGTPAVRVWDTTGFLARIAHTPRDQRQPDAPTVDRATATSSATTTPSVAPRR